MIDRVAGNNTTSTEPQSTFIYTEQNIDGVKINLVTAARFGIRSDLHPSMAFENLPANNQAGASTNKYFWDLYGGKSILKSKSIYFFISFLLLMSPRPYRPIVIILK